MRGRGLGVMLRMGRNKKINLGNMQSIYINIIKIMRIESSFYIFFKIFF